MRSHQDTEAEHPIWHDGVERTPLPLLEQAMEVDVVVAGGGITGLTTAILLASEGQRVVLVEADRIGAGTSGATSAQVTAVGMATVYNPLFAWRWTPVWTTSQYTVRMKLTHWCPPWIDQWASSSWVRWKGRGWSGLFRTALSVAFMITSD